MEKLWYIKIRGIQQGPYSIEQLKRHSEVTPDTLTWYPKVSDWIPMRSVPELKEVFEDIDNDQEDEEDEEEEELTERKKKFTNELVLELQRDQPPFHLWLFAALAIIALLLWHMLYEH